VSFVVDHPSGMLYFATATGGASVTNLSSGERRFLHVSDAARLTPELRVKADLAWQRTRDFLSDKFPDLVVHDPKCSAESYTELVSGGIDAVVECTRKRNLELAVAYLLVTRAGGVMLTESGQDLGQQRYQTFGQDKNDHQIVISAASLPLAGTLAERINNE